MWPKMKTRRKRDHKLAWTRPRTAARLLGLSRHHALELIRLDQRQEWYIDLVVVLPCGIRMGEPTYEVYADLKGLDHAQRSEVG